jgi:Putative zinc-finger
MNCFEARQEFAAFWRRELAGERRAAFSAHLAECAKCDRAFRAFALTAPALHSASEPATRRRGAREFAIDPARRPTSAARIEPRAQHRWFAMCAAVTVFVAASLAAWISVSTPVESLTDALSDSQDTPVMQLFEQNTAGTSDDFAS